MRGECRAMKSKCPSWRGKATVRPRCQGRRHVAFIGAQRRRLTEEGDGSGARFGREGQGNTSGSGTTGLWLFGGDSTVRRTPITQTQAKVRLPRNRPDFYLALVRSMFGKVLGVDLIKQRSPRDCALCVVAMLTESPYESVLAHNPNYENQTDEGWINYIRTLSFRVRRTTLILPGHRYFCIVSEETEHDPRNSHAIGIDERGRVFDPATRAPNPGILTIEWYRLPPRGLRYIHLVDPKV
jgi:hypothetical protein